MQAIDHRAAQTRLVETDQQGVLHVEVLPRGSIATKVVVPIPGIVGCGDAHRTARALLPLDWISWTPSTASAIGEISRRARQALGAERLELVVTGRWSDRTQRECKRKGVDDRASLVQSSGAPSESSIATRTR